jgi:hypothetical protein
VPGDERAVSEVHDPEVEQQSRLSSDQFADRIAQRELERIRQETPKFPRWFAAQYGGFILSAELFRRIRLVKHVDSGFAWAFLEDSLTWQHAVHTSTLDYTLRLVNSGALREIGRAEAYAITGGNP